MEGLLFLIYYKSFRYCINIFVYSTGKCAFTLSLTDKTQKHSGLFLFPIHPEPCNTIRKQTQVSVAALSKTQGNKHLKTL